MGHVLSTKDADGYGILDAADRRGYKNCYIDYLQKLALDQAGVFKSTDVVLDFGCGIGRLSAWLANRCSQVYGIDVGTDLIRLAERQNGRENVIYQSYNGLTIPFSQCYFDAILCVGVLHKRVFPEAKLSQLLEAFRHILKTLGMVVAIEHVYGRQHPLYSRREELLTSFAHHGFLCTAHYPIRKGHWPVLYLMRWGFIPSRFFPRLAQYELQKRRSEAEALLDYKDYFFCFEKKG